MFLHIHILKSLIFLHIFIFFFQKNPSQEEIELDEFTHLIENEPNWKTLKRRGRCLFSTDKRPLKRTRHKTFEAFSLLSVIAGLNMDLDYDTVL